MTLIKLMLLGITMFMLIIVVCLFSIKTHFLLSLLWLEGLVLMSMTFTVFLADSIFMGWSIFFFTLTLGVCEAALALTLLMTFIKLHGNDFVTNMI
uniref:NADH dehydrogenase subunit 4L n=1 Tax=Changphaedusa horikawai TaxID=2801982 RepID=A0A224A2H7_9EUPU|nr:NADH dehydrogenase subunit 4L [Phaedusa horikawai]